MEGILKNGHSIALDKKQEIKGAVAEIDIFLKTLQHFQNMPKNHTDDLELISPVKKEGVLSKFFKK